MQNGAIYMMSDLKVNDIIIEGGVAVKEVTEQRQIYLTKQEDLWQNRGIEISA